MSKTGATGRLQLGFHVFFKLGASLKYVIFALNELILGTLNSLPMSKPTSKRTNKPVTQNRVGNKKQSDENKMTKTRFFCNKELSMYDFKKSSHYTSTSFTVEILSAKISPSSVTVARTADLVGCFFEAQPLINKPPVEQWIRKRLKFDTWKQSFKMRRGR